MAPPMIRFVTSFKERISFIQETLQSSLPRLFPRRGHSLEDPLQDIVLIQLVALGVEVEQDSVPQHWRVELAYVLESHVVTALHQRAGLRGQYQELRGADAGSVVHILLDEIGRRDVDVAGCAAHGPLAARSTFCR